MIYKFLIGSEEAENFKAVLEENFPDIDVEMQPGGQPVYYYIVSVE